MLPEVAPSEECPSRPDPVFVEFLRRARHGCPDAARELYQNYSRYLRIVIRRRMHRRLRPLYDSMDFVQCVWASFLQRTEETPVETPEAFVAFLTRLATNKLIEVQRQRLQTVRRDLTREEQHENLDELSPSTPCLPTASQLLIAEEHWERLKKGQSPEVCEVLELLRQGYSHREVAERTRLHPKMIQRLLQKLQKRLGLA